jgi:hypothetical protein
MPLALRDRRKLIVGRVCIATVIQIAFLAEGLTATDQTRGMIKPVITQQIVMNLSILAAVVLGLHNSIANLTASRFGVEVHESTDENRSKTSGGGTRRRQTVTSNPGHNSRIHHSQDHRLRVRKSSTGFRPGTSTNNSKAWALAREPSEWDDCDRASHGSQENIIMQTMTWQVPSDEAGSREPNREAELQTPPLKREVGKSEDEKYAVAYCAT